LTFTSELYSWISFYDPDWREWFLFTRLRRSVRFCEDVRAPLQTRVLSTVTLLWQGSNLCFGMMNRSKNAVTRDLWLVNREWHIYSTSSPNKYNSKNTERQRYFETQCAVVKTNVTYQWNLIFKCKIRITQRLMEDYYAFIILCDVLVFTDEKSLKSKH